MPTMYSTELPSACVIAFLINVQKTKDCNLSTLRAMREDYNFLILYSAYYHKFFKNNITECI